MAFSRSIFMTGFPGFIAARLVERLCADDVRFYLLVEERFVELARSVIERIADLRSVPLENFAIVPGDITLPDLGIEPEDIAVIRAETTEVFHLAAAYDLAVSRTVADLVNVEGTRNVNALAASIPDLKRYHYVSTCYVAGKRTGRIQENELEHAAGFRNEYERSKYEAELDVEKLKDGLPVTIYRPSVVVGDSKTGETAKYDGVYCLIFYLLRWPAALSLINVGNDDVRLNLVPVDFVIDAIAALSRDNRAIGKTLAIADPSPMTTHELFDVIAKELAGRRSILTPPSALVKAFLSSPISPPLTGLPAVGVPYFFLSQTYDTSQATELLQKHGVKCPDLSEYISKLIEFVRIHPEPPVAVNTETSAS